MDFICDESGLHLLRIDKLLAVPDYVKSASVDSESVSTLGDHLFADAVRREFPCDTAGHTYLSHAYCRSADTGDAAVRERIKLAAARHGITADLETLEAAFAGLEKSAQEHKPSFAIEIDFGQGNLASENMHIKQGGVRGFYPINTVEEIEVNSVRLGNDRERLPLEIFAEGCQNVVKAAQALGMARQRLPRTLWQYGEERLPNYEYVEHEAAQRLNLTGDSDYLTIAKEAAARPEERQPFIDRWVQADNKNGVKYSGSHPDPYLIFNSGPVKSAVEAELKRWVLIDEAPVPNAAIAGLSPDLVNKLLSKEAAAQVLELVKKAAADEDLDLVIEALPSATRKSLLKILAK